MEKTQSDPCGKKHMTLVPCDVGSEFAQHCRNLPQYQGGDFLDDDFRKKNEALSLVGQSSKHDQMWYLEILGTQQFQMIFK